MKLKSPKHLYLDDRPREKLIKYGSGKLSTNELLQVIIGSGNKNKNVSEIAVDLSKVISTRVSIPEILKVGGIGFANACKIIAGIELGARLIEDSHQVLDSPGKFLPFLFEYKNSKQECLILFTLNGANQLIESRLVSMGTVNSTLVHPREVYSYAIQDRASAIVIAHNHPSGNLTPSPEDVYVTNILKEAGNLLGIKLLDHIIFNSKSEFKSVI